MSFEEKITTALVYKAIIESGTIQTADLYSLLGAKTTRQKHDVRNSIQTLKKSGKIENPKRGTYVLSDKEVEQVEKPEPEQKPEPVPILYRHYVSVTAYCDSAGKKPNKKFYALTFKDDDEDIENKMWNAIINETKDSCGNWNEDKAYAAQESDGEGKNSGNTYPEIEVGEL